MERFSADIDAGPSEFGVIGLNVKRAGSADTTRVRLNVFEVRGVIPIAASDFGKEVSQKVNVRKIFIRDIGKVDDQVGIEQMVGEAIVMVDIERAVLEMFKRKIPR